MKTNLKSLKEDAKFIESPYMLRRLEIFEAELRDYIKQFEGYIMILEPYKTRLAIYNELLGEA